MPSILLGGVAQEVVQGLGFKPCYKWNAFNTLKELGIKYRILEF